MSFPILVIGALGQSLGPNLVVPADALVASPSPAREGEHCGEVM